jgi:hypothetical protein
MSSSGMAGTAENQESLTVVINVVLTDIKTNILFLHLLFI